MFVAHRIHDRHKIVHFVRHAEGYHNVAGRNDMMEYLREDLLDAKITDHGKEQCRSLYEQSQSKVKSVELVVISPMTRTLQTGEHSFPHLRETVPWIALDFIREQMGSHPCDKRNPLSHYREQYPFVEFGEIEFEEDVLYDRYGNQREPKEDVLCRAREFLNWLKARPEKEVLVITHSAFLRHLFGHVLKVSNVQGEDYHFENCELRTFVLALE